MKPAAKFPLPLYCLIQPGRHKVTGKMMVHRSGEPAQFGLPIYTREVNANLHASVRREGEAVLALNTIDDVRRVVEKFQPNHNADYRVIVDPSIEEVSDRTMLTRDAFLAAEFVPTPAIDNTAE